MTPAYALPSVFILTDEIRLPDPVDLVRTLPSHWGLIFRHYGSRNRFSLAKQVARVCRQRGLVFLIAGDWRLACDVGADGVHMPEGMLKTSPVSPLLNATRSRILTTSAHDPTGLHLASAIKADAVFLSPVHETKSHLNSKPLGVFPFGAMARQSRLPVYALGGIDLTDAMQLYAIGASGIAGISLAQASS